MARYHIRSTRPRPLAALLTLAAFATLLALGFWQLERLEEKRELIARIAERTGAAPTAAPAFSSAHDDELEYRRVRVTGAYRHDLEVPVYALGPGGAPGYHIYTPFQRDRGGTVLVNRGWVPVTARSQKERAEPLLAGVVTVEGILRLPAGKGRFTPENRPRENEWYWPDLDLIAAERGLDQIADYVIEAVAAPGVPGQPRGGVTRLEFANNHLGYALTWFFLALALAVMFTVYHLRRKD